jgi:hypothetical protein
LFDYGPRFEPNELHYPVPSYLDSEGDFLEPELFFEVKPVLGDFPGCGSEVRACADSWFRFNFLSESATGWNNAQVENTQLTPNPMPFNIPTSDRCVAFYLAVAFCDFILFGSWQDWSRYLEI